MTHISTPVGAIMARLRQARWVQEARRRTGLTQADFGRRLGLGGVTVCDWETGTREPSEEQVRAICAAFGDVEAPPVRPEMSNAEFFGGGGVLRRVGR